MDSNGLITPYKNLKPVIHEQAYTDRSARIVGDVEIAEGASIWPMAVLRADTAGIRIGKRTAVLDLALLEAPEGFPVWIEDEALISHGVIIHGARVQPHALVGIRAIILDGAVISTGSIIGAGSLITANTQIPPNSLVVGVPGKVVRETTERERANIAKQIEELYQKSREYMGKGLD